jgi:hypothetical protein
MWAIRRHSHSIRREVARWPIVSLDLDVGCVSLRGGPVDTPSSLFLCFSP